MNNIDLATQKIRQLQEQFFKADASPNSLFLFVQNEVMPLMDKASTEIRTNYAEISDKLTKQMNTGRKQ